LHCTIISQCKCLIFSWVLSIYRGGLYRTINSRTRFYILYLLARSSHLIFRSLKLTACSW
jgi:hypothetical protein